MLGQTECFSNSSPKDNASMLSSLVQIPTHLQPQLEQLSGEKPLGTHLFAPNSQFISNGFEHNQASYMNLNSQNSHQIQHHLRGHGHHTGQNGQPQQYNMPQMSVDYTMAFEFNGPSGQAANTQLVNNANATCNTASNSMSHAVLRADGHSQNSISGSVNNNVIETLHSSSLSHGQLQQLMQQTRFETGTSETNTSLSHLTGKNVARSNSTQDQHQSRRENQADTVGNYLSHLNKGSATLVSCPPNPPPYLGQVIEPLLIPTQNTSIVTPPCNSAGKNRRVDPTDMVQSHKSALASGNSTQATPTPGSSAPYFDRVLEISLANPTARRPALRRTKLKKPAPIDTSVLHSASFVTTNLSKANVPNNGAIPSAPMLSTIPFIPKPPVSSVIAMSAPPTCMPPVPSTIDDGSDSKPKYSYMQLIAEAIESTPGRMMSLQEIYDYIRDHYVYFRNAPPTWQNSIRHNLSVQKIFEKKPRPQARVGKGGMWTLTEDYKKQLPTSDTFSTGSNSISSSQGDTRQAKRIRFVNKTKLANTQHQPSRPHQLVRHSSQQILHSQELGNRLQHSNSHIPILQRSMSMSGIGTDSITNAHAHRQNCFPPQPSAGVLNQYFLNVLGDRRNSNPCIMDTRLDAYPCEPNSNMQESFRRMLNMSDTDEDLLDSGLMGSQNGSFFSALNSEYGSMEPASMNGFNCAYSVDSPALNLFQHGLDSALISPDIRHGNIGTDMTSLLCDPMHADSESASLLEGTHTEDYSLMPPLKEGDYSDVLSLDLQSPFARGMTFSSEIQSAGAWPNQSAAPFAMASAYNKSSHTMSAPNTNFSTPILTPIVPSISAAALSQPTLLNNLPISMNADGSNLVSSPGATSQSSGLALMNLPPFGSAMPFSHVHDPQFQDKTLFQATRTESMYDSNATGVREESPFLFSVQNDSIYPTQAVVPKPLRANTQLSDDDEMNMLSL
ncbi:hypothetical protein BDV3_001408 [Batrachochytrium dendrobatidis]|uniref:Fork-head domain-containing protein n=1 Tax=Batrachochytrium dendrobatidis (strain JEL423) TaxID=403673 RepID=A0A177W9N7_BATDL|nr:hypothetical protein BDEG_20940 [Batrachochytrium dendrobatidis JEL423]